MAESESVFGLSLRYLIGLIRIMVIKLDDVRRLFDLLYWLFSCLLRARAPFGSVIVKICMLALPARS